MSLITEESSFSVTEKLDLPLIDLASVFGKAIITFPSHSGLYHIICFLS